MNAPAIAPERSTLDVELAARNNCRYNLGGLRCRYAGRTWTIRSTTWLADPGLWLFLDGMTEPVHDSMVTLLDPWKTSCCRSSLTHDGLPKPKRRKGAR